MTPEGEKEVLGLWIEQTDGAKFSLKVMNELKTRGVADILIAWYIGADAKIADPLVEP
jgi:putative transposase